MKKIFALLLALVMVLGLAACGNTSNTSQPGSNSSTPESSDTSEEPSNTDETAGEGGTIMFLSVSSSGPTYDAMMAFLEGMGGALGYDIKVVYGDPFNDPDGNLTAVKNGMTDDVVALITMQDGGIQNIMDEYPDLYVVGYNNALNSVYGEGGASAAVATYDHFLGGVAGDLLEPGACGKAFAEKVIENGYHKISLMSFPEYAYPEMADRNAAFRAAIEEYNATAAEADQIEIVGDTHVLEFAPLEDSYFMESDHADLDCIVAFCDPSFVYGTMISARDQGLIDGSTKLFGVGFDALADTNYQADIGGDGTVQMIYGSSPEGLAYCMAMIDNAVNGQSYPDYEGAELVDATLYIVDSTEDIQNLLTKTMLGAPDFANSGVTVEQIQNVLLRYNADATYASLMELMASDNVTLERFN